MIGPFRNRSHLEKYLRELRKFGEDAGIISKEETDFTPQIVDQLEKGTIREDTQR